MQNEFPEISYVIPQFLKDSKYVCLALRYRDLHTCFFRLKLRLKPSMSILEEPVLRNTSNEALSDGRKRELCTLISKIQGEIVSFDAEITNLRSKRRMKMATLTELKAIISPVKELPNEIIAKIFVHYMTRKTKSIRGAEIPQLPWCLGQICSRWRGVALSTSELWTDVAIQIPPAELTESSIERSADLLSRARNLPLNLTIHQSDSSTSATCLLPLFTQNAASIRRLVLYKLNQNLQLVLEQRGGLLEQLEALDIYFGSKNARDRSSFDIQSQVTIFENSPSLRRLSIITEWWMCAGYFDFRLLNIPWSQLIPASPRLTLFHLFQHMTYSANVAVWLCALYASPTTMKIAAICPLLCYATWKR